MATLRSRTQPDYAGAPVIRIDGSSAGAGPYGLQPGGSGGSELRGLSITRWAQAEVSIQSPGNKLFGNWLGESLIVTEAGSAGSGVVIESSGNQIGSANAGDGNRIRDHRDYQVLIRGAAADDNIVAGNHLGAEPGEVESSFTLGGVRIQNGAERTKVGLPVVGGGNSMRLRAFSAVRLENVADTVVQNNTTTRTNQGRASEGVYIDGGTGTLVGGSGTLDGNTLG
jgi:hypothetical protein